MRRGSWRLFSLSVLLAAALGACGEPEEDCTAGTGDEDEDGDINCDDSDCDAVAVCQGVCGDGTRSGNEPCEGNDVGGASCIGEGFDGGAIACAANCTLDLSGCTNNEDCVAPGDEDLDGDADCADTDCAAEPRCTESGAECSDNQDNDGDTQIDCFDADCAADPTCVCGNDLVNGNEQCDGANLDGEDCISLGFDGGNLACNPNCTFNANDCFSFCGDGLINNGEECDGAELNGQDCSNFGFAFGALGCDANCTFDTSGCTNEDCTPGSGDEDLDGDADCADFDCIGNVFCIETNCNDGLDEENDGLVDCSDPDCAGVSPCDSENEVICTDLFDDDADGLFDCQDPTDCQTLAICQPGSGATGEPCVSPSDCQSVEGQDPFCFSEIQFNFPNGACAEFCDLGAAGGCSGDGICIDIGVGLCFDACTVNSDCQPNYTCQDGLGTGDLICFPGDEVICNDAIDDDNDGLIDCLDTNCDADPACLEICNNATDDDNDGLVDCADGACVFDPACAVCGDGVGQAGEECDDGNTQDGDGCDQNCVLEDGSCSHDICTEGDALINACNPCVAIVCAEDDFCCDTFWDSVCVNEVAQFCGIQCGIVCGNFIIEGGEECDDGNTDPGDGCDQSCQLEPENFCDNFVDDDADGLFDCQDPTDCQTLAICTPGAGATGGPCAAPSDCEASDNDPACLTDDAFGAGSFPGGSCSEFCDLANPVCAGDAVCADVGLGSSGLCLDTCEVNPDCRLGYACQDIGLGALVCFGASQEVACDDNLDEDNDGLVDCDDPDCGQDPICPVVCGNGVGQVGEECDDGNLSNGDGCNQNCLLENGSCSHDICTEGSALVNGCNPCVSLVCAQDPFCCDSADGAWDGICVGEVPDFCEIQCGL